MENIEITRDEIEKVLKSSKGWIRQISGNEYVYDFHLSKIPVIIKVLSTVPVEPERISNRGSSMFRVWAVEKSDMSIERHKVIGGISRCVRFTVSRNWKDVLQQTVIGVIYRAKRNYTNHRKDKRCSKLPEK